MSSRIYEASPEISDLNALVGRGHQGPSLWRKPEDDDRLDQQAFYERCRGKLPDSYWIESACILRALMGITRH